MKGVMCLVAKDVMQMYLEEDVITFVDDIGLGLDEFSTIRTRTYGNDTMESTSYIITRLTFVGGRDVTLTVAGCTGEIITINSDGYFKNLTNLQSQGMYVGYDTIAPVGGNAFRISDKDYREPEKDMEMVQRLKAYLPTIMVLYEKSMGTTELSHYTVRVVVKSDTVKKTEMVSYGDSIIIELNDTTLSIASNINSSTLNSTKEDQRYVDEDYNVWKIERGDGLSVCTYNVCMKRSIVDGGMYET